MSRIVLDHVTKRFGNTVAVDNLSLEIDSGSFFSLLGPSGCGKTTTMRLIAGLETADEGRIWIGEQLVFDSTDHANVAPGGRGIGMVFQNYALWPHMTVKENVLFGLKVRRIKDREQAQRLERVLKRLQIAELIDRYPSELSGGQQQRIALARELVTGARVLLMDEPLSNLDAKLRIDMRVELKELHEETGGTIIYVTHDQIEALTLSTRMALMKSGLMQQNDTPDRVFAYPQNLFVAQFMGQDPINLIEAQVSGKKLSLAGFELPRPDRLDKLADGDRLYLAARPEELALTVDKQPWSVPAVVDSVLTMGYSALVRLRVSPDATSALETGIPLTVAADERHRKFKKGDSCRVVFDRDSIHLFDIETEQRFS